MIIIGIDPGKGGGVSAIETCDNTIVSTSMPETIADMEEWLVSVKTGNTVIYMEELTGFAGGQNTGSTMFTMAKYYWAWEAFCQCYAIRLEHVRPAVWQKFFSLGNRRSHATQSAWKNHLKQAAQRLFPELNVTLKNADSLLIMEYGRRQLVRV
jgi:hypothetical protein